jgi:hypothetical protein
VYVPPPGTYSEVPLISLVEDFEVATGGGVWPAAGVQPQDEGTLVRIRAENVPEGIRPEDHDAGLNSSLEKLARLVEAER